MKFPNAFKGISKIYSAEILNLISALCMGITGGLGAAAASAMSNSSDISAAGVGSLAGAGIFGIAAGVISIIAFIFTLIGLNAAGKDEQSFKNGFIAVIVGIVLSVLSSALNSNAFLSNLFSTLSSVINLFVTIMVIQGVINLAKKYNDNSVINRGNTLLKIVVAINIIAIVLQIIKAIVGRNNTANAIAGVLAIVAAVLMIVQIVMYLKYLKSAKEMLA